ncbi:hypothetical protein [Micromonospora sp. NPDC047134]|uniref:hypothetical protein n=1 Tax=Micromonospora sp. NPDC047134 TaxID=3154340 RepID=UPI0033F6290E
MPQLPICPVCAEPVADQPAQSWTGGYRGGTTSWWHLADNTPICPNPEGIPSQVAFVEDGFPADSASGVWIDATSGLFAIDGPYDPARLGSAIIAVEHLTRWLHTATGSFSALLTLRTPSDVAVLVGHLHRLARLLARVHAQTASHLINQARQAHFTGLDDDSEMRPEVIDAVDDVDAWLQDAADQCAQSARATGVAWSQIRRVAALTTATSGGRTNEQPSPAVGPDGQKGTR